MLVAYTNDRFIFSTANELQVVNHELKQWDIALRNDQARMFANIHSRSPSNIAKAFSL